MIISIIVVYLFIGCIIYTMGKNVGMVAMLEERFTYDMQRDGIDNVPEWLPVITIFLLIVITYPFTIRIRDQ